MIPITKTNRLVIRTLQASDAPNIFLLNTDPEVLRYTGDSPFSTLSEAENFLKNYPDYKLNGFGRWAVILKESNEFIGWCGLKLNEEQLVDIGFRFFKKYWGNGYATEAAKACLNYGFHTLHLKEIIGRAAIKNVASIRILKKLHMTFWKNGSCNGIQNSVYYKISSTQFKSIPG